MNQEPQEILKATGVNFSMAWFIFYLGVPEEERLAYKTTEEYVHWCNGCILDNSFLVLSASRDFGMWYRSN